MKKLVILLFTIMLMLLLTACEPASKREILRYAKEEYGEVEFIKEEVVSEDEITYYVKDVEYGFEYYITSYVSDINIDGSKFGEVENKKSNFNNLYYNYITEKLDSEFKELEDIYKVDIVTGTKDYNLNDFEWAPLAEIYYKAGDEKTAPTVSKKVKDLYKEYDNRNYLKCSSIDVYNQNEEIIGNYDLERDMWMTQAQKEDYYYIDRVKGLDAEAEYVRKEQKLFKDTGLSLDDVAIVLGNEPPEENTVVTYYYFTVDGKEFFLADVLLDTDFGWYNNYDQVMGN